MYTQPLEQRFWSKVNKHGPRQPHMKTRCWLFEGAKTKDGYGKLLNNGSLLRVHRYSYELHKRPLGKKLCCHRCDVRNCVRPSHLFKGTDGDNCADRDSKGRQQRGESHALAKLSDKQVLKIRKLYATGKYTQRDLRDRFGVSCSQICYIVNRQQRTI